MSRCGGELDEALPLNASHGQGFDSLPPGHAVTRSLWVEGAPVSRWAGERVSQPAAPGQGLAARQLAAGRPAGGHPERPAVAAGSAPLHKGWLERWEEAMQPPGDQPAPQAAHQPERPDKRTKTLAFGRQRADARLEFVWFGQAHIVIPTRRVYLVSNAASIVRVRDGTDIPATSLSIELDTDSWAWQFTAQDPAHRGGRNDGRLRR